MAFRVTWNGVQGDGGFRVTWKGAEGDGGYT
jgi:hypothetical protein